MRRYGYTFIEINEYGAIGTHLRAFIVFMTFVFATSVIFLSGFDKSAGFPIVVLGSFYFLLATVAEVLPRPMLYIMVMSCAAITFCAACSAINAWRVIHHDYYALETLVYSITFVLFSISIAVATWFLLKHLKDEKVSG